MSVLTDLRDCGKQTTTMVAADAIRAVVSRTLTQCCNLPSERASQKGKAASLRLAASEAVKVQGGCCGGISIDDDGGGCSVSCHCDDDVQVDSSTME